MLKKSLLLALSLLLVFSLTAFAGEGSDTVGGGKLLPQLRYGYSGVDWRTNSVEAAGFRNWDVNYHSYFAQVNWGVLNNLDLIVLAGGRSLTMESDLAALSLETDGWVPMFTWGIGFKTTFFRADNGFYAGGGALFTHSISREFDLELYNAGVFVTEFDAEVSAYVLTPELHVGWHIGDTGLTPYMGVDYVYSRAVIDVDPLGESEAYLQHPFFMFVGLDHYINDRLYLNFEGRTNFNDGWGIEGGIGYLFDLCPKPAPAPPPAPAPVIEPKLEPMSKN